MYDQGPRKKESMKSFWGTFRADILLLLTAIIWGFAFVAQRSSVTVIGPFAYNAARFALGALALAPLLWLGRLRKARPARGGFGAGRRAAWAALAGMVLFAAASLQQIGMITTTAGNAGFITCLYVILVPVMSFCSGRSSSLRIWIGAALALSGLYVLCIGAGSTMAPGDILEFRPEVEANKSSKAWER